MRLSREELIPTLVKELLSYDPETGLLMWRRRDLKWFKNTHRMNNWNAKWAAKRAFTSTNRHGYNAGTILEIRVLAHRVAWAIHYDEWPSGEIDHINGVKTDNRISNLRDVPHEENLHNAPRRSTNSSGATGVFWNERSKNWRAYICVGSRLKHIGYFKNFDDALAARKAAEKLYGFHPNHGREKHSSAA